MILSLTDIALLATGSSGVSNAGWSSGGAPDGNWQTAANWNGVGLVPGDWLSFGAGSQLLTTNNFPAGLSIDNITFNSGAPSFTLDGNGIVLANVMEGANGIFSGGAITNSSINSQTINLPVTLSAGSHVITAAAGAGQLNLNGAFSRGAGGLIQFNNSGFIATSGSGLANNASGILGGWALASTSPSLINNSGGAGMVNWASLNSGAVTAYNSYTSVTGSGATIPNSANDNILISTDGSSDDKVSGATTVNTINFTATADNGYIDIPAGDTLQLGAQGAIMINGPRYFRVGDGTSTGALTAGGAPNTPGELSLYNLSYYASGALEAWCYITDNGSSAYPVTLNIYGSVNIDFANTYSGGTCISAGNAYLNLAGATFGYGPVYVLPGGRADFGGQNDATITNNFYIEGPGFLAASAPGAIKGSYNGKFTGSFSLSGDAWIDPNAGSWPNTCTFAGPIGGTGSLTIGGPANVVAGTATFSGNNNYTGDLIIDASANANSGAGVFIANGKNNIINIGGNVDLIGGSSTNAIFDLDGTAQTMNGLTTPSGMAANALVTNSSSSAATLTISNDNTVASFGGTIMKGNNGVIALTKLGGGTQVFTGINTYAGNTTINGGTLALNGSGCISNSAIITIAAGATLDASGRSDQTLTLASNQTLQGAGTINVNLTVGPGAKLMPGNSTNIATLTVANTARLQGSAIMKLNASSGLSDRIDASSFICGGTLTVTNLSGVFQFGQSFQLFAGGSYSGSFSAITLPPLGGGLAWANNLSSSGLLQVVATAQPNISSFMLSGTNLILSGTNGVDGGTFVLLNTTNLALPLDQWATVMTNVFDSNGNFSVTNCVSTNGTQQFYILKLQ